MGLIPGDLLDAFFGTASVPALLPSSTAASKTGTGGTTQSKPSLVPGLDSVIDNLAGTLAVK